MVIAISDVISTTYLYELERKQLIKVHSKRLINYLSDKEVKSIKQSLEILIPDLVFSIDNIYQEYRDGFYIYYYFFNPSNKRTLTKKEYKNVSKDYKGTTFHNGKITKTLLSYNKVYGTVLLLEGSGFDIV